MSKLRIRPFFLNYTNANLSLYKKVNIIRTISSHHIGNIQQNGVEYKWKIYVQNENMYKELIYLYP